MAVVMIMEWPGVTLEQYDQARELIGWEREVPAGGMYHVAAHDDRRRLLAAFDAGAERPRDFQVLRVLRVDLLERAVTKPGTRSTPTEPFTGWRR